MALKGAFPLSQPQVLIYKMKIESDNLIGSSKLFSSYVNIGHTMLSYPLNQSDHMERFQEMF